MPGITLSAEGQIKVGDKIQITGKNPRDTQLATVKEVIKVNGCEEVIINVKKNYYFITKNVVAGKSWAASVVIVG